MATRGRWAVLTVVCLLLLLLVAVIFFGHKPATRTSQWPVPEVESTDAPTVSTLRDPQSTGGVGEGQNRTAEPARSRSLRISLAPDGKAELIEAGLSPGAPLYQRHARLAPGLLLVVGYKGGAERWRVTVPDPRVRRLETFAADGTIAHAGGERLVPAVLSVAVPTTPAIDRVEILDPQWSGTGYELLLLVAYTF